LLPTMVQTKELIMGAGILKDLYDFFALSIKAKYSPHLYSLKLSKKSRVRDLAPRKREG